MLVENLRLRKSAVVGSEEFHAAAKIRLAQTVEDALADVGDRHCPRSNNSTIRWNFMP